MTLRSLARGVVLEVRGETLKFRRNVTKYSFEVTNRSTKRKRSVSQAGAPDPVLSRELKATGFVDYTGRVSADRLDTLEASVQGWVPAQSRSKDFFHLLTPPGGLRSSDPAVAIAVDPAVAALATAYFGEVPYLLSVELIRSTATPSGTAWKKSQLWHKDHNDTKVLKLFIYLNDVDESNGPFTFIPESATGGRRLPYFPVHKSDEWIAAHVGGAADRRITGSRGTAFFIDTARLLHRGSRIATDRVRLAYVATYTSFAQLVPRENGITVAAGASSLDRLLLQKLA